MDSAPGDRMLCTVRQSLADHGRPKEAQHLTNRIRNCAVRLPAKSNPTAWGFVATSSTISDPESPPARNELPLFAITI